MITLTFLKEILEPVQDGLTLANIENTMLFILFIRFLTLAFRYNLKTSFYITCIGFLAGYLWYRHFIDLISMYRNMLLKMPLFYKLGNDAGKLRSISRNLVLVDLRSGSGGDVHWYQPDKLLYYAFQNAVKKFDSETGLYYYIDPISMIISRLSDSAKSKITPYYYELYTKGIPFFFRALGNFSRRISGLALYVCITRFGRRYCPYLIRWHWTYLLVLSFIEPFFLRFGARVSYFINFVLVPQYKEFNGGIGTISKNYAPDYGGSLLYQIDLLNTFLVVIVSLHLGSIISGMLHAICGQYFYFPFIVENTEVHIGSRPKNSIYGGGNTPWQDKIKKTNPWYRLIFKPFIKIWSKLIKIIINFVKIIFNFIINRIKKRMEEY